MEYGFSWENERVDLGHVGWGSCESSGRQRHGEALGRKKWVVIIKENLLSCPKAIRIEIRKIVSKSFAIVLNYLMS